MKRNALKMLWASTPHITKINVMNKVCILNQPSQRHPVTRFIRLNSIFNENILRALPNLYANARSYLAGHIGLGSENVQSKSSTRAASAFVIPWCRRILGTVEMLGIVLNLPSAHGHSAECFWSCNMWLYLPDRVFEGFWENLVSQKYCWRRETARCCSLRLNV